MVHMPVSLSTQSLSSPDKNNQEFAFTLLPNNYLKLSLVFQRFVWVIPHLFWMASYLIWAGHFEICLCAKSLQSHSTLCNSVDCSLLDSCPGDAPGKNNGVGCQALLQGISHTQASTRFSLIGRQILPCLSHQGSSWKVQGAALSPFFVFFHLTLKTALWSYSYYIHIDEHELWLTKEVN